MKMTMQDLIIGHYEGGLTPSQESELQTLLAASPEARAMYEHHGVMQEAMEEESERLIPPIALRQATIGAALGVTAESIGGGIAAWLTSKVAIAIGTVVVGGAAAGIVLSTTGDDAPSDPPAAVTAPAAVETTQKTETIGAPQSGSSEEAAADAAVDPVAPQPATSAPATAAASREKKPVGTEPSKPTTSAVDGAGTPRVRLEDENGPTVSTPTTVRK